MKREKRCPKCGDRAIREVRGLAFCPAGDEKKEDREIFDVLICENCGFSELYAPLKPPLEKKGKLIHLNNSEEDEDWFPPAEGETEELFEGEFAGEDMDITEVSRVSKRPPGISKAKVVLVKAGSRIPLLLSILQDTLGLDVETEDALKRALPLTVLDNISMEAAIGLKKLLEDGGGTAEIKEKTT